MDQEALELVKTHASAVVCVRDEATNLEILLPALRDMVGEIIVVDGGSTDGSRSVAQRYADSIVSDDGTGKGAAIRIGAEHATREVVVFVDGDLSHDPAEIPMLVLPILGGLGDMVVGSRSLGGSRELHGTLEQFFRATGSHVILLAINARFGVRLTDSQNGFRAVRRSLFRRLGLREPHTTIEQEMTTEVLRRGYRVLEMPTHEYARYSGESKISLFRHSHGYVTSLIRFLARRRKRPTRADKADDAEWRAFLSQLRASRAPALDAALKELEWIRHGVHPAIVAMKQAE